MAAGPEPASARCVELQDRCALHEVEHAEARGEARAARRRQHVVGAGDIVADHLRRVRPRKIAPALRMRAGQRLGIARSRSPDARRRCGRPAPAPRRATARRITAPKSRQLARGDRCRAAGRRAGAATAASTRSAKAGIVGDQDRLRGRVVLGLGQQVGGEPVRIVVGCRRSPAPPTGPAIMSMPTVPNTCRLAAAT